MRLTPIGVWGRIRPATGPAPDTGAPNFIAAKPLARLHLLLHRAGCDKQTLVYAGGLFLYFRLIERGFVQGCSPTSSSSKPVRPRPEGAFSNEVRP